MLPALARWSELDSDPRAGVQRPGWIAPGTRHLDLGIPATSIRRNYRLRGDHRQELESELHRYFRPVDEAQLEPGDVLMLAVTSDQLHLAIRTVDGFVHANAGIGRVVETPGFRNGQPPARFAFERERFERISRWRPSSSAPSAPCLGGPIGGAIGSLIGQSIDQQTSGPAFAWAAARRP